MQVTRRNLFALAAGAWSSGALGASVPSAASVDAAAIDRIVGEEMARRHIPGLTLAIMRGAAPVHACAYGRADLEWDVPMTIGAIFQSASTGKMFTTAAIQLLTREGRLGLDDPITRHLQPLPDAWSAITLRHMMSHRSGIPDIAPGFLDADGRPLSPALDYEDADLIRAFGRWPLDFLPGSRFRYSNTAFALLGFVIKAVSGQFYGDYLRDRLFGPAGMPTAQVNDIHAIVPGRARGFLAGSDGNLLRPYIASRSVNRLADGALLFGAPDWVAWSAALRSGVVLNAGELADSWRSTSYPDDDPAVIDYGLGWFLLDVRGRRLVCHHGIWQGFSAWIGHYPDDDLTIAMMCNLENGHPGQFAARIAGLIEPRLGPRPPISAEGKRVDPHHAAIAAWLAGKPIGRPGTAELRHQRRAAADFGGPAGRAPELLEAGAGRYLYRVANAETVGLIELRERGGAVAAIRMPRAWPIALYETGGAG